MELRQAIGVVWTVIWSSTAFCGDAPGILPRGASAPKRSDVKIESSVNSAEIKEGSDKAKIDSGFAPCHQFLAADSYPRLFTHKDGFYVLARTGTNEDGFAYQLVALRTEASKPRAERLLSFSGPRNAALLVSQNTDPMSFTILNFSQLDITCPRGEATGVTIPYNVRSSKQLPPLKSIKKGLYSFIDSDIGRLLVDLSRSTVKEIDPQTGLQRVLYQFERKFEPLYWFTRSSQFYAFDPETSKLVRRGKVFALLGGELVLQRGDRLLGDRDRFAQLRVDPVGNKLEIAQLNQWSTAGKTMLHVVQLPTQISANEASISANFATNLITVQQSRSSRSRGWQKMLIYKLRSGLLNEFNWDAGLSLGGTAISAKGDKVLVFLEDRQTALTKEIKLLDVKTNRWEDVPWKE